MATIVEKPGMHVEAHYLYGGLVGLLAGLVMAVPAMLYTLLIGESLFAVPSGIAAAFVDTSTSQSAGGILLGLAVHLGIAFATGIIFAVLVQLLLKGAVERGMSLLWPGIILGVAIWGFNWFVLLPLVHPDFLTLLTYAPSFVLHLVFGATLALYGRYAVRR